MPRGPTRPLARATASPPRARCVPFRRGGPTRPGWAGGCRRRGSRHGRPRSRRPRRNPGVGRTVSDSRRSMRETPSTSRPAMLPPDSSTTMRRRGPASPGGRPKRRRWSTTASTVPRTSMAPTTRSGDLGNRVMVSGTRSTSRTRSDGHAITLASHVEDHDLQRRATRLKVRCLGVLGAYGRGGHGRPFQQAVGGQHGDERTGCIDPADRVDGGGAAPAQRRRHRVDGLRSEPQDRPEGIDDRPISVPPMRATTMRASVPGSGAGRPSKAGRLSSGSTAAAQRDDAQGGLPGPRHRHHVRRQREDLRDPLQREGVGSGRQR